MELFIGIGVAWAFGMGSYAIYNKFGKKRKLEYFDLTNRVVKNKRFKDGVNNRVKGMFNK